MSPEKQQKAIAEACGLNTERHNKPIFLCSQCGEVDANHSFTHQTFESTYKLPDYLNDRNAMVAALMTLTPAQRVEFGEYLGERVLGYIDDYYTGWSIAADAFFEALTAPLDKVAKCFLQTIHKWEDK